MAPSSRAAVALAVVLGTSAAGPARADCRGTIASALVPARVQQSPVAALYASTDSATSLRSRAAAVSGSAPDSAASLPVRTPSGRLRLSFGAAHATVLDPLASPMRYGGGGPGAGLSFAHVTRQGALELSVETALPQLRSALSAQPEGPREATVFTAARALWLRRLGRSEAAAPAARAGGLLLGVEARFEGSLRDHRYREPALHFFYGLALASLGPAARWRSATGWRGELSVELAAPLLGVAYRPYGDLAYIRSGIRPRLAAPPSLTALDGGAAWAVPLGRSGARAVAEWRLAYLRYRDHDLYRSARQRLGLGLDLPTGYHR